MIKTTDLFDNNENVFDEIWNHLDPQQFIFAQIIEYCRKKTFTELKKDVQRDQSDKKWTETYQHTENIENLENDYFKHSCLAIFNEQIEKHAKSSEIKQAIMKIFHKDAKIKENNTLKSLSINKKLEKIIPVFAYWILRLDVAVSDKLLDNNQASHMDKTDVQPKFEKSDVFEKLKKKVQSDVEGGGQTEKDIIDKLFQEIIDQANGLNVNPFSSTFQFKI